MATTTATEVARTDIELHPVEQEDAAARHHDTHDHELILNRSNSLKLVAAGFSFFFAGTNDGSLGALTPYILRTYNVGTGYVALIYASTFFGWVLAAATNSHLIRYLDLGSLLTLGAVLQLLAQLLRFWTPPFGLYAASFFIQAAGLAYQDTHANTFVASIKGAHRWLGFIHAMYALGCLVSPFVATAIAASATGRWPLFYTFLVGLGSINALAVIVTFHDSLKVKAIPEPSASSEHATVSRSKTASRDILETLKLPAVYTLSLFYFFFLGASITAGGWVVEYLVSARNGRLPDAGYVSAGLWGGTFLGRVLLAEPTHRFGERRMAFLYCCLGLAAQLVFWLVPNLISSAVAICLFGFFFGPLFATGMSIGSKLFDKRIQPTALGFVFVLAQAGGALFPALTGVIASQAGVRVMQPILVGLILATGLAWILVPRVPKHSD